MSRLYLGRGAVAAACVAPDALAPDALEPVAEQTLEQGVLEGRTLFAATGDTGSSCPVLVLGPDAGAGNGVANARDFNDYSAGTNGFYQATPGWDYVSGWGTPVLGPLMTDIDGRTTPGR